MASKSEPFDDEQEGEAIRLYLEALDSEEAFSRSEFLEKYPQHAHVINEFADTVEGINDLLAATPNASTVRDFHSSAIILSHLSAGRSLGPFELLEELGQGQYGVVWKARDTRLQRNVAVKIPHRMSRDRTVLKAAFREAKASAELNHPNLVRVHEVGEVDGMPYIVSDFVPGITLKEWIADQLIAPRDAAEMVAKLADAIQHAHERGVIHRDLKPENILVTSEGEPHITDFGLARRDSSDATATLNGLALGTPAYMSPEQASGESSKVDHRSDIYSLGAILYELLGGAAPFQGNARMVMQQLLNDEADSLSRIDKRIPKDLDTIALKCLAKEPEHRYQSSQKLQDELQRFLEGRPILARPSSTFNQMVRWAKRKPTTAALVLLALALTVLGPLIAVRQQNLRLQAEGSQRRAENERAKAVREAERANQSADEARRSSYFSNMVSVPHLFSTNRYHLARQLLAECSPAERHWEWRYWNSIAHPEYQVFREKGPVLAVRFSPDGRRIASAGHGGFVTLHSMTNDNLIKVDIPASGKEATSLAFHPRGDLLLVGYLRKGDDDPSAILWNILSMKPVFQIRGTPGSAKSVAFDPTGRQFFIGHYDGSTSVWDSATGEELQSLKGVNAPVRDMAWSSDGKHFITASANWTGRHEICIHMLPLREKSLSIEFPGECQSIAAHPCKPWLFAGLRDGSIALLKELDAGSNALTSEKTKRRPKNSPPGSEGDKWSLDVSQDCNWLACGSRNHAIELIALPEDDKGWKNSESLWLSGHGAFVNSVDFAPSGQYLASGAHDATVRIWRLNKARRPQYLFHPQDNIAGWPICKSVFVESPRRIWRSSNRSTVLRCFDPETGAIVDEAGPFPEATWMFAARSPELFAVASEKGVFLYETQTSRISTLAGTEGLDVSWLALGPQGKWVAYAVGVDVLVRSTTNGKLLHTLKHHAGVKRVVSSEDGALLGTVLNDSNHTVHLWSLRDDANPIVTRCFESTVYSLAISQDNSLWMAASGNSVEIERVKENTGRNIELSGHEGVVTNVRFCEGGSRIATTTLEGSLHLWDAEQGREVFVRNLAKHLYSIDISDEGTIFVGGRDDAHGPLVVALYAPK